MEATEKQINFARQLGIDSPEKYDKQTLSSMIEVAKNKGKAQPAKDGVYDGKENFPVYPKGVYKTAETGRDHKYDKDPTGLAVEIFVQVVENAKGMEVSDEDTDKMMKKCINLVKQAQEAFI